MPARVREGEVLVRNLLVLLCSWVLKGEEKLFVSVYHFLSPTSCQILVLVRESLNIYCKDLFYTLIQSGISTKLPYTTVCGRCTVTVLFM